MTDLFVQSQWRSSPIAYWTIQYEHKRSGTDMMYRFAWKVWLKNSTSYYYNGLKLKLFLNGGQIDVTVKSYNKNQTGWSYSGTTDWYLVEKKTSGTVPFYAQLYDTNTNTTEKTSSTYSLAVDGATSVLGTIADFDVENGVTIPITKYDSSFTDKLVIGYGTNTLIKTINGITNGAKVTFTSAELTNIFNLMSTTKSATFTFTLYTSSGSTSIGNTFTTAKGSISNANPTFSASNVTYQDTNSTTYNVTGNRLHIVQNKSTLSVTYTKATGNKGASISSYKLTLNGVEKTSTSAGGTVSFGTVDSATDLTLTCVVTDSRGNTTKVEKTITMLEYTKPSATIKLERLNNYEDKTYLTVDANYSSLNGKNSVNILYAYTNNETGYTSSLISIAENQTVTLTLDKNAEFTVAVGIIDKFQSVEIYKTLPRGTFPLFIHTDKNAVGINTYCRDGEALRVAGGSAYFEKSINVEGEPLGDFVVQRVEAPVDGYSGSKWNATLWKSGYCELHTRILFTDINCSGAWGSVYTGTVTGSNIKYPVTFERVPSCNVSIEYSGLSGAGNYWLVTNTTSTANGVGTSTRAPLFQIARSSSANTSASVYLNYFIRGYIV